MFGNKPQKACPEETIVNSTDKKGYGAILNSTQLCRYKSYSHLTHDI